VPSNVLPRGLDASVRSLKSPLVGQLVAFTRRSWSPLAEGFLQALVGNNDRSRPLRDAAQLSLPRRPPSQRPTSRPRRPILVPNCRNQLSRGCSLNRRPRALLAR